MAKDWSSPNTFPHLLRGVNDTKMHTLGFIDIKNKIDEGIDVFVRYLNQGSKYYGSIVKVLEAEVKTYGDSPYLWSEEKFRIKLKDNKNVWVNRYSVEETNHTYENIQERIDEHKISKDFLGKEFEVGDVVFLYSSTYGEMLGVVKEISPKGTIKIKSAKQKQTYSYPTKKLYTVPHYRASRVLIIDDPQIMLLKT